MAKINALTHTLNTGEISQAALNRVDKEVIRLYAEQQENLLPYSVGKAIMRPGFQWLTRTHDDNRSRLIPFEKSIETRALLELGYDSIGGKLRVIFEDAVVTRPSVTSTVADGDFASSAGWTSVLTGDATATFGGSGILTMAAPAKGGLAIVKQQVSTSSAGIEHALRIVVQRGAVTFSVGSTDGGDDYISRTTLEEGTHSLAFTPSGSYWVQFRTKSVNEVRVDSIEVEAAGEMAVDGYWDEDSLRQIRYAQSLDVVFVALSGGQQIKIERRGNTSWSVVRYRPTNGPFTIARTADIRLTPSVTQGNGTLTASEPFFESGHVGALFQLTHDNTNATYRLGALNEVTKPIRVVGLNETDYNDRTFTVTVSGTFVGTLTIERSFDSEFTGFETFAKEAGITAPGAVTTDDDDDNAIVWYRVKMTAYTSGSASVRLTYGHDGGTGVARITAVNSSTSADIEVTQDFTDVTSTDSWLEGDWSGKRGWPTAVAFFDGRLFWARTDRFWGSVSNSYYNFSLDVEGDSGSIQRDVSAGDGFSEINWLLPLQRLLFGAVGQEVSARTSAFDEPLTPTNITLKSASTFGTANISPVKVDKRGVFIGLDGRHVYEIAYDVDFQDYATKDLMRLCEDIWRGFDPGVFSDGFVELAVQRAPEPYIWAVRDDGMLCLMLFNPSEEARGWFRVSHAHYGADTPNFAGRWAGSTPGLLSNDRADKVVSVTVLRGVEEDDVYVVMERHIGNLAVPDGTYEKAYFIEKLRHHSDAIQYGFDYTQNKLVASNGLYMADSHVTSSVVDNIVSAPHLPLRDVIVIGRKQSADDVQAVQYQPSDQIYTTDADGDFTCDEGFIGTVVVGLPYAGYYKSAKLAYGAEGGTALAMKKQVGKLGLALLDTHPNALRIGPAFSSTEMDELPRINSANEPIDELARFETATDEAPFPFPGQWDTDSRICIYVQPGHSACLSGLIIGVDSKAS